MDTPAAKSKGPSSRRKLTKVLKRKDRSRQSSSNSFYHKKLKKSAINISLNASHNLRTLRINNKALAQSLEKLKGDLRILQNANAALLEENHMLREQVITLSHLIETPATVIEEEVNKQYEALTSGMRHKLKLLNTELQGFVQNILGNVLELSKMCSSRSSTTSTQRGSSLFAALRGTPHGGTLSKNRSMLYLSSENEINDPSSENNEELQGIDLPLNTHDKEVGTFWNNIKSRTELEGITSNEVHEMTLITEQSMLQPVSVAENDDIYEDVEEMESLPLPIKKPSPKRPTRIPKPSVRERKDNNKREEVSRILNSGTDQMTEQNPLTKGKSAMKESSADSEYEKPLECVTTRDGKRGKTSSNAISKVDPGKREKQLLKKRKSLHISNEFELQNKHMEKLQNMAINSQEVLSANEQSIVAVTDMEMTLGINEDKTDEKGKDLRDFEDLVERVTQPSRSKRRQSVQMKDEDDSLEEKIPHAVAMRITKPGKLLFSASRKESDGKRKSIPLVPVKARSKTKKQIAEMIDNLPQEEPQSIFDFHDKTPKLSQEKQKDVFSISADESNLSPLLPLHISRQQKGGANEGCENREEQMNSRKSRSQKKALSVSEDDEGKLSTAEMSDSSKAKVKATTLLGGSVEYTQPLKSSPDKKDTLTVRRGRSKSRSRCRGDVSLKNNNAQSAEVSGELIGSSPRSGISYSPERRKSYDRTCNQIISSEESPKQKAKSAIRPRMEDSHKKIRSKSRGRNGRVDQNSDHECSPQRKGRITSKNSEVSPARESSSMSGGTVNNDMNKKPEVINSPQTSRKSKSQTRTAMHNGSGDDDGYTATRSSPRGVIQKPISLLGPEVIYTEPLKGSPERQDDGFRRRGRSKSRSKSSVKNTDMTNATDVTSSKKAVEHSQSNDAYASNSLGPDSPKSDVTVKCKETKKRRKSQEKMTALRRNLNSTASTSDSSLISAGKDEIEVNTNRINADEQSFGKIGKVASTQPMSCDANSSELKSTRSRKKSEKLVSDDVSPKSAISTQPLNDSDEHVCSKSSARCPNNKEDRIAHNRACGKFNTESELMDQRENSTGKVDDAIVGDNFQESETIRLQQPGTSGTSQGKSEAGKDAFESINSVVNSKADKLQKQDINVKISKTYKQERMKSPKKTPDKRQLSGKKTRKRSFSLSPRNRSQKKNNSCKSMAASPKNHSLNDSVPLDSCGRDIGKSADKNRLLTSPKAKGKSRGKSNKLSESTSVVKSEHSRSGVETIVAKNADDVLRDMRKNKDSETTTETFRDDHDSSARRKEVEVKELKRNKSRSRTKEDAPVEECGSSKPVYFAFSPKIDKMFQRLENSRTPQLNVILTEEGETLKSGDPACVADKMSSPTKDSSASCNKNQQYSLFEKFSMAPLSQGGKKRRAACAVNYAEPSLNKKLRRGDPFTSHLYRNDKVPMFRSPKSKAGKKAELRRDILGPLHNLVLKEESEHRESASISEQAVTEKAS